MHKPKITTFIESREQANTARANEQVKSRGEWLQRNIGTDDIINTLKSINGRVAIAIQEREIFEDRDLLDLLRHFNEKGISLDLWANLEDKDGYWMHAGNIPAARRAILEMLNHLEKKDVNVSRIGLDLELPAPIMVPHLSFEQWKKIAPWRFSQERATEELCTFINEVLEQSEYDVDAYEIPILSDYHWMRRLLGILKAPEVESPRYRRVGMVYTSRKPPIMSSDSFIEKYSKDKGRIPALGIVSSTMKDPGRDMDFGSLLDDEALHRDIQKALQISPNEFYIFALDGLRMIERVRDAIRAVS